MGVNDVLLVAWFEPTENIVTVVEVWLRIMGAGFQPIP